VTTRPGIKAADIITEALRSLAAEGAFATCASNVADELRIEVDGVGRLSFPIVPRQARQLIAVARPARYGLKSKTLLDKKVRDCWEVAGRHVHVDEERWRKTLDAHLLRFQAALGLLGRGRLTAKLHNLLVYEQGQFFAPHQDSEKSDGMIGTLVVTLPSTGRGGDLIVFHHDEELVFEGNNRELTLVAFYADCRHEVRAVRSGYRIALTYNLSVEEAAPAGRPPSSVVSDALVPALIRHFQERRPPRWNSEPPRDPPDRFVYLLDHQYTQKGLSWKRLKNHDASRAAALAEAAGRLDCEIYLALADVHEQWSCADDEEWEYGWGRRGRRPGRQQRKQGDTGYDLIDLIDGDIELRHFVPPKGPPRSLDVGVSYEDVCYTKASRDLKPFESEHEGYMGNYGDTVDRWYHRAAVVLWPRTRNFVLRAKADPPAAVRELLVLGNDPKGLLSERVAQMLPFWARYVPRPAPRGFAAATMELALRVGDHEAAAALCAPLPLDAIGEAEAQLCGALVARHGSAWGRQLVSAWLARHDGDRAAWTARLGAIGAALREGGGEAGLELARSCLGEAWSWLAAKLDGELSRGSVKQRTAALSEMGPPLLGLLCGTLTADHPDLRDDVLAFMTANEREELLPALLALLHEAARSLSRDELAAVDLLVVYERALRLLTARRRRRTRAAAER
jgi:hypothetical protein